MLAPVLVTPPALLPITVEQGMDAARAVVGEEEALIEAFIEAAVSHLDGWTGTLGRCLVSQRWRQDFCGWWDMRLPFPMACDVVVTYRDAAGASGTVDPLDYRLEYDALEPRLVLRSGWTTPNLQSAAAAPVTVEFDAGYGGPDAVPAAIRQAIKMMVAHWYANREAVAPSGLAPLPLGVTALLTPYRVVRL